MKSKNGLFSPSIVPWWGLLLGAILAYIGAVLIEDKAGLDALGSLGAFVGLIVGASVGLGIGFLAVKQASLRTLIPALTVVALVAAIGLTLATDTKSTNEDENNTNTNAGRITVYATNAAAGGKQFAADLTKPLKSVSCVQWEQAVKTHTVTSPRRVFDKGNSVPPQPWKVLVFTSELADDNWLFAWADVQTKCPDSLALLPVKVFELDGRNEITLDVNTPVSYMTCAETETFQLRKLDGESLADAEGNVLVMDEYREVNDWGVQIDVAVYVPDLTALCEITASVNRSTPTSSVPRPTTIASPSVANTATATPRPPITVGGFTDKDDFLQYVSIWDDLEFIDINRPSIKTYEKTVKVRTAQRFDFYWCAANKEKITEATRVMSVYFDVNGIRYDPGIRYFYPFGDTECHVWAVKLSNWIAGQRVTLDLVYQLEADWRDEDGLTYRAGEYIQRINVVVEG